MFGSTLQDAKVNSRGVELILIFDIFECFRVQLTVFRIDSNLKLEFGIFECKFDYKFQRYCSTHFYMNVFKSKLL